MSNKNTFLIFSIFLILALAVFFFLYKNNFQFKKDTEDTTSTVAEQQADAKVLLEIQSIEATKPKTDKEILTEINSIKAPTPKSDEEVLREISQ